MVALGVRDREPRADGQGGERDILTNEEANAAISAYIAKKIGQRVKDPKVADKLLPKDHGFGTRRVPLESGYFETYHRDNVTLTDTLVDEPIECITPHGIKTTKQEHEFDILIYATVRPCRYPRRERPPA